MTAYIKGVATLSLALTTLALVAFGNGKASEKDTEPSKPARTVSKLEVAGLAQRIDRAIQEQLDAEKVPVSGLASDAEFMRRLYLDIAGVIPPADKVAAFLDSKDPDKRAKLIDELLASPAYGKHMADIWQALLLPRTATPVRGLSREPMVKWLEEKFNANTSWDKMVSELLTASGPQDKNGAVTFFASSQTADKMTDNVCKLFLGVRLECAQCHDHPFTGWKREEYWGMAAFFTKVNMGGGGKGAKQPATPTVSEDGKGRQRLPESAKVVPAKFLQGAEPKIEGSDPRRPVLAAWMTAADNPFFARALVNRLWHHFYGRGFVNPVDDMHKENRASHPALLSELSEQFVASGFDVKHMIRAICNSQAYQRTSKPNAENEEDATLFSHMAVKVLAPEQLFDSLEAVIGKTPAPGGLGRPGAGRQVGTPRQQFVTFFSGDENADPTEYQHGIPQALRLMNSPQVNRDAHLLNEAVKADAPEKVIEQMFLGTLSRRPTEPELSKFTAYVKKGDTAKKAYGDILWALLNCSEFTLNH
jgi:hypothetical protein